VKKAGPCSGANFSGAPAWPGDDRAALDVAAQLVRDAGFDPVPVEPLSRGKELEPGTKPYNTGTSGPELRTILLK
jgi:hypothetical protein